MHYACNLPLYISSSLTYASVNNIICHVLAGLVDIYSQCYIVVNLSNFH